MIAIIDYGAGNIFSVKNALDFLGLESSLVSDRESVINADAVILPGVGAFPAAMKKLESTGLIETIRAEAAKKPFLGICLGMQVIFEKGYEFEESIYDWTKHVAITSKENSMPVYVRVRAFLALRFKTL